MLFTEVFLIEIVFMETVLFSTWTFPCGDMSLNTPLTAAWKRCLFSPFISLLSLLPQLFLFITFTCSFKGCPKVSLEPFIIRQPFFQFSSSLLPHCGWWIDIHGFVWVYVPACMFCVKEKENISFSFNLPLLLHPLHSIPHLASWVCLLLSLKCPLLKFFLSDFTRSPIPFH